MDKNPESTTLRSKSGGWSRGVPTAPPEEDQTSSFVVTYPASRIGSSHHKESISTSTRSLQHEAVFDLPTSVDCWPSPSSQSIAEQQRSNTPHLLMSTATIRNSPPAVSLPFPPPSLSTTQSATEASALFLPPNLPTTSLHSPSLSLSLEQQFRFFIKGKIAYAKGTISRRLGTNMKEGIDGGGGIAPLTACILVRSLLDSIVFLVGVSAAVVVFLALNTNTFQRRATQFENLVIVYTNHRTNNNNYNGVESRANGEEGGPRETASDRSKAQAAEEEAASVIWDLLFFWQENNKNAKNRMHSRRRHQEALLSSRRSEMGSSRKGDAHVHPHHLYMYQHAAKGMDAVMNTSSPFAAPANQRMLSRSLHVLFDGTVGRSQLISALSRRVGEKVRNLHKQKAMAMDANIFAGFTNSRQTADFGQWLSSAMTCSGGDEEEEGDEEVLANIDTHRQQQQVGSVVVDNEGLVASDGVDGAGAHIRIDDVGPKKHSVPSTWSTAEMRDKFVENFESKGNMVPLRGLAKCEAPAKNSRSKIMAHFNNNENTNMPIRKGETSLLIPKSRKPHSHSHNPSYKRNHHFGEQRQTEKSNVGVNIEEESSFSHVLSEEEEGEERLLGGEELAVGRAMEPETRQLAGHFGKTQYERNIFDDDATFYVSISQFKDVLCPYTIKEIYEKARNPRRVFVGIVDQRDDNLDLMKPKEIGGLQYRPNMTKGNVEANLASTCVPWYMQGKCATSDFCPTDNIRVRRTYPKDGKGPTWGRYYGMLMYQGESYFMMIDSHSRFVPHWDASSVLNLHLLPKGTRKAVLSHYPSSHESYDELISQRREPWMMTMCNGHFKSFGIIRMDSEAMYIRGFPIPQYFSAGGYVFGDADYVHEVPFDPHLNFVFDGEEVLYSVRLWTHGYDLFTPRNNILFHNYARHNAPRFWNLREIKYHTEQQKGQARVKYFMKSLKNGTNTGERIVPDALARAHQIDREEEVYGLGTARPLEEYYRRAGVDTANWRISKSAVCDAITYNRRTDLNVRSKNYLEWSVFSEYN